MSVVFLQSHIIESYISNLEADTFVQTHFSFNACWYIRKRALASLYLASREKYINSETNLHPVPETVWQRCKKKKKSNRHSICGEFQLFFCSLQMCLTNQRIANKQTIPNANIWTKINYIFHLFILIVCLC